MSVTLETPLKSKSFRRALMDSFSTELNVLFFIAMLATEPFQVIKGQSGLKAVS